MNNSEALNNLRDRLDIIIDAALQVAIAQEFYNSNPAFLGVRVS